MGFRFFRRVKIAPGLSLNFSKSGVSPSFGVRGARVTVGRSGTRKTVGIPGTGLYYTTVDRGGKRSSRSRARNRAAPPAPTHNLDLNFFEKLTTPKSERVFVEGCKAYVAGRAADALRHFEKADGLADAAFLAGMLHLQANRADRAAVKLSEAVTRAKSLSTLFKKYGVDVRINLPITDEIAAQVGPSILGTKLALAEAHQLRGRLDDAIRCLDQVRGMAPDDPVLKLSLAELLLEARPGDKRIAKRVVEMAGDVSNETPVHAALLLYKARALRTLGLAIAAKDILTTALRRRKDRDADLLIAIRYERSLVYEELGQPGRTRQDLESIYAEDPGYEDVAARLGL